jgi:predicted nicotinamide N-methyase
VKADMLALAAVANLVAVARHRFSARYVEKRSQQSKCWNRATFAKNVASRSESI